MILAQRENPLIEISAILTQCDRTLNLHTEDPRGRGFTDTKLYASSFKSLPGLRRTKVRKSWSSSDRAHTRPRPASTFFPLTSDAAENLFNTSCCDLTPRNVQRQSHVSPFKPVRNSSCCESPFTLSSKTAVTGKLQLLRIALHIVKAKQL